MILTPSPTNSPLPPGGSFLSPPYHEYVVAFLVVFGLAFIWVCSRCTNSPNELLQQQLTAIHALVFGPTHAQMERQRRSDRWDGQMQRIRELQLSDLELIRRGEFEQAARREIEARCLEQNAAAALGEFIPAVPFCDTGTWLRTQTPTRTKKMLGQVQQANEEVCSICLVEFSRHELVKELACQHCFHVMCLSQWFLVKTECPLCKAPAAAPKESRPSQVQNS